MSPRFATQPPRLYHRRRSGTAVLLSFLIHRHLTPSLLSSSRSFPLVLPRVFCSCLPAKHDQSLFPVRRHDTPFTPTAILEEGLLRQRRVLSATGRMCDHPSDDYREITHVGLSYHFMNFVVSQRIVDVSTSKTSCISRRRFIDISTMYQTYCSVLMNFQTIN